MRFLRVLVVLPLWLLLTAEASPTPTTTDNPSPAPSPSPSALPTPVNAFLSLDVTAGPATTVIGVAGGQFLPNQQVTLYWDTPNKVAGTATADANGSFNTRVKPNASDKPGVHKLCASVQPNPCANFALQAATPTPSPSPTPEESPSPSPQASPTPTLIATPARTNSTISGFDVITRPPFVFLPIFGAGALLLSLAYWAFMALRRPRKLAAAPTAAVVHRATRPDYAAPFGTPPPRQAEPPQQSAWDEPMPGTPPRPATPRNLILTPAQTAPQPQPQPRPHAESHSWGLGEPDTGYPDLSAPGSGAKNDIPEPPQPSD